MTMNEYPTFGSNASNVPSQSTQPYRFRLMQGTVTKDGKFERSKSVGMAYLKEGQSIYTLRLWTFLEARFYLIQSKDGPSRYLLMTREPTKSPNSKNKYHWNIVGNGRVDAMAGVIRLQFDLFEQPIYLSLYPEASSHAPAMAEAAVDEAA